MGLIIGFDPILRIEMISKAEGVWKHQAGDCRWKNGEETANFRDTDALIQNGQSSRKFEVSPHFFDSGFGFELRRCWRRGVWRSG
jgi:hypothetical protein